MDQVGGSNALLSSQSHCPKCSNASVKADLLEAAVWSEVCQLLKNPQSLQQEYQRRLNACDEDYLTKQIRLLAGCRRKA